MKTSTLAPLSAAALDSLVQCCVVGLGSQGELSESGKQMDMLGEGWLTRAVARGDLSGKRGELALLPNPSGSGVQSILVAGVGDRESIDAEAAFELGGTIIRRLLDRPRGTIVVALEDFVPSRFQVDLVAGSVMAAEGQDLYQNPKKSHPPEMVQFMGFAEEVVDKGSILGTSMNLTRRLVNEPANHLYPERFAQIARDLAEEWGFECEVWDEQRLDAERCHAMLAVGQASVHESKLVILRYRGADKESPPLALVGKGVTFDSGGLSIKPSPSMVDMKCDMAGAATVLGTILALARMRAPVNVMGYCGLVENMIAGNALRLGDVITTRSGKSVEILNTDAEGRVVLADVLNVAIEEGPSAIIDLATLTGACMVALGTEVCGLFSNDPQLAGRLEKASREVGEYLWPMPMFPFYAELIRSKVADIKNTGDGRWAGAITAAKFLEEFVENVPWAHIDIAGPAFAERAKGFRDAGGTGVMLRTLVRFLEPSVAD